MKVLDILNNFFYENKSGVTVLETAIVFPTFIMIVFGCIELTMINNTQLALDSIVAESSIEFMQLSNKRANFEQHFTKIIQKYLSSSFSTTKVNQVQWHFEIFDNVRDMNLKTLRGKGDPAFVEDDKYTEYIPLNGGVSSSFTGKIPEKLPKVKSGNAFMLTFVCDYKFSFGIIEKILLPNTKINERPGSKFIIWSRGCGVVH